MTKREFAARLLFWLLPWPISRALPRALRIYYFGPGGAPPPGWYYPPGVPGFPWPDPYNPPPPEEWPDLPDGPTNPGDPYVPGPGPVNPAPGIPSIPYFDDTYWTAAGGLAWNNVLKAWTGNGVDASLTEAGTWNVGFRASYLYIEWAGVDMIFFRLLDTNNDQIARVDAPANKVYIPITFGSYDLWRITMDGDTIQIRDICFI